MSPTHYKTPGVYVEEISAFPNSVAPVATAIPAFIGYTPQAEFNDKSFLNKPVKITSYREFIEIYGFEDEQPQYQPGYFLVAQNAKPGEGRAVEIGGDWFSILPDPDTIYYLANSVRLYFENGGTEAYIVSVGGYGAPSGKSVQFPTSRVNNKHVQLPELLKGLAALKREQEPTFYICPEATLLGASDNTKLIHAMLAQAAKMQTLICLLDVPGAIDSNITNLEQHINDFRGSLGTQYLKYGAAYYPFVYTSIMQQSELSWRNLFGGDIQQLARILMQEKGANAKLKSAINKIDSANASSALSAESVAQYHQILLNLNPAYAKVIEQLLQDANTLPPSGGMAGVCALVDQQSGVWKAPANVSMVAVTDLPVHLNNVQQERMNVDVRTGKFVNAIRSFPGRGILVWGARTLDGNNPACKYINVCRTLNFFEQSIKMAIHAFVFEPNDANTWTSIKAMIENFLINMWNQGALIGSTLEQAFTVNIGLNNTMTANDVLNGVLIVEIHLALVKPAEFIVIRLEQKMAES